MKIAFIGGGNMGEAILSAILDRSLSTPQSISVSDIDETRRQHLEQKYGVAVTSDNRLATDKSEVVVLAIKPQHLAGVMVDLKDHLNPAQLALSIIAGIRIDTLCLELNHRQIVRAMPNTPAQIGEGMSVWTATSEVTTTQKERTGSILSAMGREIYVDEEKYLDMATAVSGSGPAYFFLFIESLVESAMDIGLTREVAAELVLQTMLGSAHLLRKSGKPPSELRRLVTSPGGTTAAAMLQFEKGGLTNLVKQAVSAAYHRSRELAGN
ncbi:MAG: pyrroline-5-carboxylate reductase [Dehalococcoidales bacterium]|nr:pyrroline-5-carboxylate reductase [Dehalococcoidales bacterium]